MNKRLTKQTIIEKYIPDLGGVQIVESDRAKLPEGVLAKAIYPICNIGELNKNKRMYEGAVFEAVDADPEVKEKVEKRCFWGHAEHPKDSSQSNTEKISHIVTRLFQESAKEKCAVDILDTPYGRIIERLLAAKCGIGMSTRAEGDLEECVEEGKEPYWKVIPEAYKLHAVDFTADASTYGAYPESVERDITGIIKTGIDNEKIDRKYATLMLESMHVSEAKSLLESITHDKKHAGCQCKNSEKKCTKGCQHAVAEAKIEEQYYRVTYVTKDGKVGGAGHSENKDEAIKIAEELVKSGKHEGTPLKQVYVEFRNEKVFNKEVTETEFNAAPQDKPAKASDTDAVKGRDDKERAEMDKQKLHDSTGKYADAIKRAYEDWDKDFPKVQADADDIFNDVLTEFENNGVSMTPEEKTELMREITGDAGVSMDEAAKEQWMQKAFAKRKGGLHKALGVPEGDKIPAGQVKAAAASGSPRLKKMAQAAINANPDVYKESVNRAKIDARIVERKVAKKLKESEKTKEEIIKGIMDGTDEYFGYAHFDASNMADYTLMSTTIQDMENVYGIAPEIAGEIVQELTHGKAPEPVADEAKEVKCRYCGKPSEDKSGVCAACYKKEQNESREITKNIDVEVAGKHYTAMTSVLVSEGMIEEVDILKITEGTKDITKSKGLLVSGIKKAVNAKLDSMSLKDLQENKTREIVMKRKITESTEMKTDFESIYKEMQKVSDEHLLSDKDRKLLSESKTAVDLQKALIKIIAEARLAKAIAIAEREKAIELGERGMMDLNAEITKKEVALKEALAKVDEALKAAFAGKKELGEKLMKELKSIYEKKMEALKAGYEKKMQEQKATHEAAIFQQTVVEKLMEESGLDIPEDTKVIIRQCKTKEAVEKMIEKVRFALKESVAHGRKPVLTLDTGDGMPQDESLAMTEKMIRAMR